MDYTVKIIGYCYHSVVNVITIGLGQSDHIKRLLLYLEICTLFIKLSKKLILKGRSLKRDIFSVCCTLLFAYVNKDDATKMLHKILIQNIF